MSSLQEDSINKSQPFIIAFFKAIICIKGLARKVRKWKALMVKSNKKVFKPKPGERSEFTVQIKTSGNLVSHARAGADVITLDPEKLSAHMTEKAAEKEALRLEKHKVVKKIKNRRRFGRAPVKENGDRRLLFTEKGFAKSRGNIAKGLVVKLNSMNAASNVKLYRDNNIPIPKDQNEVANKFSFYESRQNMPRNNAMSAFQYLSGTNIYFGSEICLQARHGGYLSYAHKEHIRASAPTIFASTRFVIINCDTPADQGALMYGKPCLLEVPGKSASTGEVLGANFGSGHMVNSKIRKIVPTIIKWYTEEPSTLLKAHQYGRWICLNKKDPLGTIGDPVCHGDHIMFEQEWNFIGSSSPYDCCIQTVGSFEQVMNGDNEVLHPSDDCSFKIVLLTLPSENGEAEMKRQQMEMNAHTQMANNKEWALKMRQRLTQRFETKLPAKLSVESVVDRDLAHKRNPELEQLHLVNTYIDLYNKGFDNTNLNFHKLRQIYGAQSPIYLKAQEKFEIQEKRLGRIVPTNEFLFGQHIYSNTQQAERRYWDIAQDVKIPSEAYSEFDTYMDKYFEIDLVKKIAAAKVIQKYFHRKLKGRFQWTRFMPEHDTEEQSKLQQKEESRRKLLATQQNLLNLAQEHGHHFKVGAAALKGLKVDASARRRSTMIAKNHEDQENLRRRKQEIRRTSEQMMNNGMSLSLRKDSRKDSQHQFMETVLVEGVEVPAIFFAGGNSSAVNQDESEPLTPPREKSTGEMKEEVGETLITAADVVDKEPKLKYQLRPDLGFRGYEPPQILIAHHHPNHKRCLSAVPQSPHLHPVRTELNNPSKAAEARRVQTPETTNRGSSSPSRGASGRGIIFSPGKIRPKTAPELEAGGMISPVGFPAELEDADPDKGKGALGIERQVWKEKEQAKKSKWYKETDTNINRLGKSVRRKYGLPMDVMMDQIRPTSLSTGLKFLQAVSTTKGNVKEGSERVRTTRGKRQTTIFHDVVAKMAS